jgi:ornithine decarboxylase antizyme 1
MSIIFHRIHVSTRFETRFVNLLEFAEDALHCHHVIVYFNKTRSDRATLVKTFMFLGFHVLSPNNTLAISHNNYPDQLLMIYSIDRH